MNEELIPSIPEALSLEQDQLVQKLSLLYETSQAMMTTIKLDDLIEIIMTAVTIEGGFGFNRAILFLTDQKKETLQGMIGVGPESAEEASRIWDEFSRKKVRLLEWVVSSERKLSHKSKFAEHCKNIRVPLSPEGGILARTVLEKTSFNISDEKTDPFISEHIFSKIGGSSFATVPIIAKGQATGVIMVDNIYNQIPVSDEDIKILTIFAGQAGMAIENSRLYKNMETAHNELKEAQGKLLHNEKLVALGEMAAGIAHEIKTPLVSIGGFARRLFQSMQTGPEKKYSEIIINEVARLENILSRVLIFPQEPSFHFKAHDTNQILEESLYVFLPEIKEKTIDVIKDLDPMLPMVRCDQGQVKQVFTNLIANAIQAMKEGGGLMIKSFFLPEADFVVFEVEDSGGGIEPELIGNIFNPFFSTKETGMGLGLAITHKIVTHHQGTIRVKNNPGKGTTFIVKFPALENHAK